jgi:hypothetical protein
MHKLLQLRELTLTEWADLGCALLLLPAAGLGLKLLGFERTRTLMTPRRLEGAVDADRSRARAMARMVSLAASYGPYRTTCLRKALVLRWMLARIGIAAELRIGVRKGAAKGVEAHAWVEAAGEILGESPEVAQRFAAFDDGAQEG